MKIEKITQTISTAARARGYKSVAVCKQGQKQTSGEYPRVQVSTPTLRQKSGTNNGIVTLRTEVTLCRLAESPHPTALSIRPFFILGRPLAKAMERGECFRFYFFFSLFKVRTIGQGASRCCGSCRRGRRQSGKPRGSPPQCRSNYHPEERGERQMKGQWGYSRERRHSKKS